MKVAWIDGTAGASGDMLLGALVDAGVDVTMLQSTIDLLGIGVTLRSESVQRAGLAATKVHVDVPETRTVRHLPDIVELLGALDADTRARSVATFERLAAAEAAVHGTGIDDVHFHEVGALDSIADVVAVCAGFGALDVDTVHASVLSLGSGTTRGAHGPIPVPAPAVLRLLAGIAPVTAGPAPYEATTPTGAALLAEWVATWGAMPALVVDRVACGAGSKDTDVVANIVRIVIGESGSGTRDDVMVQLDANVDDLDPRVWPEAIAALLAAGAADAWVTPIVMKKGRPAHTFSALCSPDLVPEVETAMFRETSTIGIRRHEVSRSVLTREFTSVDVDGQTVAVKIASHDGQVTNRSAEWDDVVAAAEALGWSANDVLRAVYRKV